MYKADQGRASRIGALVTVLLIGFYAGVKWYYFSQFMQGSFGDSTLAVGAVGALALLLGFAFLGFWVSFKHQKSGDFLIDMDAELRRVVWPSLQPLFDPKTEAWGHTYVVIVSTVVFTVIIWLVDMALYYGISDVLFDRLLFPTR